MTLLDVALLLFAAGAATLLYGALVEANRLVLEPVNLQLSAWPQELAGVRIAVLADLHVRGPRSTALAVRAVQLALDSSPDYVIIPGDLVANCQEHVLTRLRAVLEPLTRSPAPVIVTMGNHDYDLGSVERIVGLCEELGFKVLRNQAWRHGGITFAGVDSANRCRDDAGQTMAEASALGNPIVAIWHEPDVVESLPAGASLMISGHSHGGQFTFPGGFTPMHTSNGRKYVRGFFPTAPTPLYVSRGIGTTGFPSRLNCAPEVSLLEIRPQGEGK